MLYTCTNASSPTTMVSALSLAVLVFGGFSSSLTYSGTGDFDTYVRTRGELEENQMKKYKWEQDQISHMKEYIARFGHGSAKLARQVRALSIRQEFLMETSAQLLVGPVRCPESLGLKNGVQRRP